MLRKLIFSALALSLVAMGVITYNYVWPKVSLFYPEHRVERFRSLADAFPARPVHASSRPFFLESTPQPIAENYMFDGNEFTVSEFLDRSETTAFLVLKDGKIAHEAYFQGNEADDLVTSFSVAKSVVSMLVGIAFSEGLIDDLNDPITKYVPELSGSGFDGVPVIDVLTMSSGINFSEKYDDETTDAFTIYNKLFLHFRQITDVMNDYGSKGEHGKTFEYASINTQALGQLIEAVSGMSIADYLSVKLWQPMGATAEASWTTDNFSNVLSFWGLNARAQDFAKFGVLLSNGGMLNGKQVVDPSWIDQATVPGERIHQRGEIDAFWGYGYQWWLPKGQASDYAAIGIWGQFVYIDPERKVVIVKFSADPNFKQHEPEAMAAFRAIAQELKDK